MSSVHEENKNRNGKTCFSCNNTIPKESIYCPDCGKKQEKNHVVARNQRKRIVIDKDFIKENKPIYLIIFISLVFIIVEIWLIPHIVELFFIFLIMTFSFGLFLTTFIFIKENKPIYLIIFISLVFIIVEIWLIPHIVELFFIFLIMTFSFGLFLTTFILFFKMEIVDQVSLKELFKTWKQVRRDPRIVALKNIIFDLELSVRNVNINLECERGINESLEYKVKELKSEKEAILKDLGENYIALDKQLIFSGDLNNYFKLENVCKNGAYYKLIGNIKAPVDVKDGKITYVQPGELVVFSKTDFPKRNIEFINDDNKDKEKE